MCRANRSRDSRSLLGLVCIYAIAFFHLYLCIYKLMGRVKEWKSVLAPPPLFHLLHAVDQDKKSQNVSVRLSQTYVPVRQMDLRQKIRVHLKK